MAVGGGTNNQLFLGTAGLGEGAQSLDPHLR